MLLPISSHSGLLCTFLVLPLPVKKNLLVHSWFGKVLFVCRRQVCCQFPLTAGWCSARAAKSKWCENDVSNKSKQYHNNNKAEFELVEKRNMQGQPLDKFPGLKTRLFGIILLVALLKIELGLYSIGFESSWVWSSIDEAGSRIWGHLLTLLHLLEYTSALPLLGNNQTLSNTRYTYHSNLNE